MNVIMIDESNFKQLIKSRRILAKYFQQISSRTFVGHISQQGLDNLYKEIKQITNRYTSIACFKVVTRSRVELEWIIGNKNNFDENGTYCFRQENIRKLKQEKQEESQKLKQELKIVNNNSQYINLPTNKITIQSLLKLAALFHDLGKSTIAFQKKLQKGSGHEPLRHEVISFLMIENLLKNIIFTHNLKNDIELFIKINEMLSTNEKNFWDLLLNKEALNIDLDKGTLIEIFLRKGLKKNALIEKLNEYFSNKKVVFKNDKISNIPSDFKLTISLLWLILTHHKIIKEDFKESNGIRMIEGEEVVLEVLNGLSENGLSHLSKKDSKNNWVNWVEEDVINNMTIDLNMLDLMPWNDKQWNKQVKLSIESLSKCKNFNLDVNEMAHLSLLYLRPALITSDFLGSINKKEIVPLTEKNVFANTLRLEEENIETLIRGDTLRQHLKTVAEKTEILSEILSNQEQYFRYIDFHNPQNINKNISKLFNSQNLPNKFKWQTKAENDIISLKNKSLPFFGVVISETGSGKTLMAPKILKNLGDKQRFTLALGFRSLVLQTGKSYASDLGLNHSENLLTTIIGNNTTKKLFDGSNKSSESLGSESLDLNDDSLELTEISNIYGNWYAKIFQELPSDKVYSDKIKSIIDYPIVVCTVDYLIRIVEQLKYRDVFSFLRNYSSDLILDEIDNYSPNDLISLTKLCFLQGISGKKLILMSATISQYMFNEFFEAYVNGLKIYQKINETSQTLNIGFISNLNINNICEEVPFENANVKEIYNDFVSNFSEEQNKSSHKKHHFATLNITKNWKSEIIEGVKKLHEDNYFDVEINNKKRKCSIGFIRFNNTDKAVKLSLSIWDNNNINIPKNTLLLNQCYHSKMPLLIINYIERNLNNHLNRKTNNLENYIKERCVNISDDIENIIFTVSTTSIQETGRDHDYDWSILEPISTRSLVQAAGRVRRHREGDIKHPNILLLSTTIKEAEGKNEKCWAKPGIEDEGMLLKTNKKINLTDDFKEISLLSNLKYNFKNVNKNISENISATIKNTNNYIYSNLCIVTPKENDVLQNYEYFSHFKSLSYFSGNFQKYANYKYFEKIPYLKYYQGNAFKTTFRKKEIEDKTLIINPFLFRDNQISIQNIENCLTILNRKENETETKDSHLKDIFISNLHENTQYKSKDLFYYPSDLMIYKIDERSLIKELIDLAELMKFSEMQKKQPDIFDVFCECQLNEKAIKIYSFTFATGLYKKS